MNIPERITALREVSVSADYILGLPKNLKYPERKKAPERVLLTFILHRAFPSCARFPERRRFLQAYR